MRFLKKINNLLKTHWLAIISIGGAFIAFCIYTFFYHYQFGRGDLLFENQLLFLPLVEKYFEGTLHFGDLWAPFVEHRLFGYFIIYILNAAFFDMSGFLEYYINVSVLFVSTILTYVIFYKNLKECYKGLTIQILFLPIVLLMLGLANWSYVAFGGMLVSVVLGSIFYLFSYLFLNRLFFTWSTRNALGFIVNSMIATLIFGGSYFLVYFAAVFFAYVVWVLFERKLGLKILALIIFTAVVGISIYLWNYPIVGHVVGKFTGEGYSLLHSIQFFLLAIANSIVQTSLFESGFNNFNVFYGIAIAVLLLYLYSLRVFKISGMNKKTYMPVFFLSYALGLFGMLFFLRADQPLYAAFGTWWYVHTKFGLIAILWIFYYAFANVRPSLEKKLFLNRPIIAILFLMLFIGNFYTNFSELKLLPSRRAVIINTRNLVLFNRALLDKNIAEKQALETTTDIQNLYTAFYATSDVTSRALEIMEKYSLNVFSEDFKRSVYESNVGQDMDHALLAAGWHGPEWGADGVKYRWVESDVKTLIYSGHGGKLFIDGYFPHFLPELSYKIYADGQAVGSGVIYNGPFAIEADLPPDKNVFVQLIFDKFFRPDNDVRELSVIVKHFYTQ